MKVLNSNLRQSAKSADVFAFVPVVRGENRLEVRAGGGDEPAKLVLIGAIGKSWFDDSGITEQEVRDALETVPTGKKINAYINSEGGSVKEGLGIYNAFKERRADITAHITGYALSIASVFPLGASKVVSPKSAIWMMHKAWSWNQGNADDMRQAADMLDAHDETLIDIYAAETGKSKAEIRSAMEKETWIKGADAVDFGLADETDSEEEDDAEASYRPLPQDYLSRCKAPQHILNALNHAAANGGRGASHSPARQGADNHQTEEHQMNRHQKLALLNSWGVNVKDETAVTDARLDELIAHGKAGALASWNKTGAKMDPPAAAAVEPPQPANNGNGNGNVIAVSREEFRAVQDQLAAAKKDRVRDRVLKYVDDRKITTAEVEIYVSAALNDEAGTFKILDEKESAIAGGTPLSYTGIDILDIPGEPGVREGLTGLRGPQSEMLVNIRKEHKTSSARHAAVLSVFEQAFRQACQKDQRTGREVLAANTYSATLVTAFLMDGSITDLTNVWAMFNAFTIAKDTDPYKPLAVGQLKHTTAGETTQTDPTNFEPSDGSTVGPITVTPHWYNQPMRVGPTDLNNGLRMEDLRQKAIAAFADKVTQAATAPIVAGTFTATPVISAAAAFGLSDLATLQGQLQKSPIKNLILDGTYLARVANQPGFFQPTGQGLGDTGGYRNYGWNGIYLASNWSGAGANIKGLACAPQALVRATGLPLNPPNIPGGAFQTMTFEVPGAAVACAVSMWFSLATRTMFSSFDIIAGFAAADATAGVIVASGNPG